jgi:hypothetical protein
MPVAIHIVTARRPTATSDTFGSTTFDALVQFIGDKGGTPYQFELEVRPANGEAYRVSQNAKVPQSVVAPGLSMEEKIPDGVDVTGWARIDDPMTVAIDWTSYRSTPEAVAAVEEARQADVDHTYAEHVLAKAKPAMQAKLRQSAWASTSMLAAAVAEGAMTFEQWDAAAQANLRKTLITPEQYAEAAAIARGGR